MKNTLRSASIEKCAYAAILITYAKTTSQHHWWVSGVSVWKHKSNDKSFGTYDTISIKLKYIQNDQDRAKSSMNMIIGAGEWTQTKRHSTSRQPAIRIG